MSDIRRLSMLRVINIHHLWMHRNLCRISIMPSPWQQARSPEGEAQVSKFSTLTFDEAFIHNLEPNFVTGWEPLASIHSNRKQLFSGGPPPHCERVSDYFIRIQLIILSKLSFLSLLRMSGKSMKQMVRVARSPVRSTGDNSTHPCKRKHLQ